MFSWFSTSESERFGKELATLVLSELAASAAKSDAKFNAKAEKTLLRGHQRLQDFKLREKLNVYKKAKLANAFLWTLKDKGCDDKLANQLTEWLSVRL